MAGGFKFKATGSFKPIDLKKRMKEFEYSLNGFGLDVVRDAKQLTPVDEGRIRNSINYVKKGQGVEIVVATDYAVFVEFGTKKYAKQYVSTLPSDWRAFAVEFKGGKGKGDVFDMIKSLMGWVRRKGISGTYSVKTRKRTGKKASFNNEDFDVAFAIALSILKNGNFIIFYLNI